MPGHGDSERFSRKNRWAGRNSRRGGATNRERWVIYYPKSGYEGGRAGTPKREKPNYQGLFWIRTDRESRDNKQNPSFTFSLNRKSCERYGGAKAVICCAPISPTMLPLWRYYIQLVTVEEAFKQSQRRPAIRPVFHKHESRIEVHLHRFSGLLHANHSDPASSCPGAVWPAVAVRRAA